MKDWIGTVVGVIGLIVAAVALIQTRKTNMSAATSAEAAKESAVFAAKSAEAAEKAANAAAETARIDREQWHEQRTPQLEVALERQGSTGHTVPGIRLTNIGDTDCETVEVTLEAAAGFRQGISAFIVASGGSLGPWQVGKLHHGDSAWHQVTPPDTARGRTIVRCVCHDASDEEWIVRLPLDTSTSRVRGF